jgi:hypothetical protein
MAMYYFNLREAGVLIEDVEGLDLPSSQVAMIKAADAAREVMAAQVVEGHLFLSSCIHVLNETRSEIARLPFVDLLNIVGA